MEENYIIFDQELEDFIKAVFLDDFVTYYIYLSHKHNMISTGTFEQYINSSVNALCSIREDYPNKDNIKKLLFEKYRLKIINEEPLELMKI